MKTTQDFIDYCHANLPVVIESANNNTDCLGFGILMGNYSINTMDIRNGEEIAAETFYFEWDEIEHKYGIMMAVSQYDDLIIFTDQYNGEYDV